jgi:hypothetical protein
MCWAPARTRWPGANPRFNWMPGPSTFLACISYRKDVDAGDIGAKQSFVASPGHDERDGNGTVTIVRRVPRLPTSSWPGFVPAIHVLRLHER